MYRDFLDIVGGKSDATVKVECNFYKVTGMCNILQVLMDTISNMRWQFENKATGKLLGTIVPTLSRNH